MTKILLFAGSSRKKSVNKKLALAATNYAKSKNIDATFIDLKDYDLPIYDGDFEEANGQPENAAKLAELISSHDAIIIASPEYNGLPSPLLLNVFSWVSRINIDALKGKVAAVMASSPGGLGGLRGLNHLHILLSNLNAIMLPQQAAIGGAFKAFAEDGTLSNDKQRAMVEAVVDNVIKIAASLQSKIISKQL